MTCKFKKIIAGQQEHETAEQIIKSDRSKLLFLKHLRIKIDTTHYDQCYTAGRATTHLLYLASHSTLIEDFL